MITSSTVGAEALKSSLVEAKVSGQIDPANAKTLGAVVDRIEVDLAKQGLYGPMYEDALKQLEASSKLEDQKAAAVFRARDKERAGAAGMPIPAAPDPFKAPVTKANPALVPFFSTCQPTQPKPPIGPTDPKAQPKVHTCEQGPEIRGQITFKKFSAPLYDGADPKPSDVSQGNIGDCWFAAAMSSLAKRHKEEIKKMIKDNKDGTYTVSIYDKDATGAVKRYDVVVDAKLPVHGDKPNVPFYSSANPLWYALVEKAYAKHLGGYQFLANRDVGAVDPCLGVTGKAQKTVNAPALPVLQSTLGGASGMATVSVKTSTPDLVGGHVYSVERVFLDKGVWKVELRNPWGKNTNKPLVTVPLSALQANIDSVTVE